MIVGSSDVIANCTKWNEDKIKVKVDFVDLGNTSKNFKGKDAELADNTENNAVEADWDYSSNCYVLKGCLGRDVDIVDTRDWIKFTADFDGVVNFDGLGASDTIKVNGKALDSTRFAVRADLDYTICITRNEENSVSYFATMTDNY